jgi:hypothetical protein
MEVYEMKKLLPIITSAIVILLASGLVIAGSIGLEISPSSKSFQVSNMLPGESFSNTTLLENTGTLSIDKVNFLVTSVNNSGSDGSDLADVLNVELIYGGINLTSDAFTSVGDNLSPLTLTELEAGYDLDHTNIIDIGETKNLTTIILFDPSAGNEYQGDSLDVTFYFTALAPEIIVNEFMYNPDMGDDWDFEWIELYNRHNISMDVGNWILNTTPTLFPIPSGTTISPESCLIIARNKTAFLEYYGSRPQLTCDVIQGSMTLQNTNDEITLQNDVGDKMDYVFYSDSWGADGNNKSLERINPEGSSLASNWGESLIPGGSPCSPQNSVADDTYPQIWLHAPMNTSTFKTGTIINLTVYDNVGIDESFWSNHTLILDTFTVPNGSAPGWTVTDGNWTVLGNEYVQDSSTTQTYTFRGNTNWKDYVYEVSVKPDTAPYVGISFRVQNDYRQYWVGIHNDDTIEVWRLNSYPSGWTKLKDWSGYTYDNNWHKLKVITDSNIFKIYWDGSFVGKFIDSTYPTGMIGLHTTAGRGYYDNVELYGTVPFTPPWDIDTTGWADGLTNINVWAIDYKGNRNHTSYQFTLDSTGPSITFIEPPTPLNNTKNITNKVKVRANVTDSLSNISWCKLEWNGNNKTMNIVGAGSSVICRKNRNTVDGNTYTYRVFAGDVLGNEFVSETRVYHENDEPHLTSINSDKICVEYNDSINITTVNASDLDGDLLTLRLSSLPGLYDLANSTPQSPEISHILYAPWTDTGNHTIYGLVDDNLEVSEERNLTISSDNTGPYSPIPLSPANNSVINNDTPTFSWSVPMDIGCNGIIKRYRISVYIGPGCKNQILSKGTSSTSHTFSTSLNDSTYYWRVKARDGFKTWGNWSECMELKIDTRRPRVSKIDIDDRSIKTEGNASFLFEFDEKMDTSVQPYVRFTRNDIIIDDGDPGYNDTGWVYYSGQGYDNDVRYVSSGNGSQVATWKLGIPQSGDYKVFVSWSIHTNRATDAKYTVNQGLLSTTFIVNQELLTNNTTGSSGQWSGWYYLDTFNFSKNNKNNVTLNNDANEYVIADAIKLVSAEEKIILGDWINQTFWQGYHYIDESYNGNHTLNISDAIDLAGNLMIPNDTYMFYIDATEPRVTSVNIYPSRKALNENNQEIFYVKEDNIAFDITFNRDMNQSKPLKVAYGKYPPYDYLTVFGNWTNPTQWSGYTLINQSTENGLYRLIIEEGEGTCGNPMIRNTTTRFFVDTFVPQVKIQKAPNIYSVQNQTLAIEVYDGDISSGIYHAKAEVYNNSHKMNNSMQFGFYLYEDITVLEKYYVIWDNNTLSSGNNTVKYYVEDLAGNQNNSANDWFNVTDKKSITSGKIAFLCHDNNCNYAFESKIITWLENQGWDVIEKKYDTWTEAELNDTDVIVCSDQFDACDPTYLVTKQHKDYGKGFVEISAERSSRAGYRFDYLTSEYGISRYNNDSILIMEPDPITAGYFAETPIYDKPANPTAILDYYLKSEVIDLADVDGNYARSTWFKVNQNGGQGRYASVNWFYESFLSDISPNDLSPIGEILLRRTINWVQCDNVIGCEVQVVPTTCSNHAECSQACTNLCPENVYGCCDGCMLGQCIAGTCQCVDATTYCSGTPNYQVGPGCGITTTTTTISTTTTSSSTTTTSIPGSCSNLCLVNGYDGGNCRFMWQGCYPGEIDFGQDNCGFWQQCCCYEITTTTSSTTSTTLGFPFPWF